MVKLQDYELTLSGNNLLATPNMLQKLKQKRQGRGSSFVYQRRGWFHTRWQPSEQQSVWARAQRAMQASIASAVCV